MLAYVLAKVSGWLLCKRLRNPSCVLRAALPVLGAKVSLLQYHADKTGYSLLVEVSSAIRFQLIRADVR